MLRDNNRQQASTAADYVADSRLTGRAVIEVNAVLNRDVPAVLNRDAPAVLNMDASAVLNHISDRATSVVE